MDCNLTYTIKNREGNNMKIVKINKKLTGHSRSPQWCWLLCFLVNVIMGSWSFQTKVMKIVLRLSWTWMTNICLYIPYNRQFCGIIILICFIITVHISWTPKSHTWWNDTIFFFGSTSWIYWARSGQSRTKILVQRMENHAS